METPTLVDNEFGLTYAACRSILCIRPQTVIVSQLESWGRAPDPRDEVALYCEL
jgi:hypothetical protein